jgi:anti-sigma B factor antagonist
LAEHTVTGRLVPAQNPPSPTPSKTIDNPGSAAYHPAVLPAFAGGLYVILFVEMVMSGRKPKIVVEYSGDVTIVSFTDDKILDEADIKAIENSVFPIVRQSDHTNLVLNFEGVQFLSSAVLGILIRILTAVNRKDGKLRLCGINEKIFEIFKITRLNKVFEIHPNTEGAIKSITGE